MIITLKDEVLSDIEKNANFTIDGCNCGFFFYKLADKLWMEMYRSCRKSSMTPKEKLWQLNDPVFYEDVEFWYSESNGRKYIDDAEGKGEPLKNIKLNKDSKEKLIDILKLVSRREVGNEYRNED